VGKEFAQVENNAERLEQEISQVGKAFAQVGKEFAQVENNAERLEQEISQVGKELSQVRQQILVP
jgi:septal ring factor EnvC (AmiA/AmiB activator)